MELFDTKSGHGTTVSSVKKKWAVVIEEWYWLGKIL